MNKQKKIGLILIILIALLTSLALINSKYPYLRTDIFRSFAKGNWFITSESDTLYSMGYYGIRKYLIDGDNLICLKENKDFCKNRMIGRGGCIYDKYVYVTSRSYLTGKNIIGGHKGKLIILNKNNLSIIKEIERDIKLVEGKIYDNYLITSGLGGFDIYDLKEPTNPIIIYSYRHESYREYHGIDIMVNNGQTYVCFALFSRGIEIWDITKIYHPQLKVEIPIREIKVDGELLPSRSQVFQVLSNSPIIYAPLGITSKNKDKNKDKLGLLVFDISNFEEIKAFGCYIPSSKWYSKTTGDMQPTYIARYNNKLFVNFAEKGVAEFKIDNEGKPFFNGFVDVSEEAVLIQPIHISDKGYLYTGSYYWRNIYGMQLDGKHK